MRQGATLILLIAGLSLLADPSRADDWVLPDSGLGSRTAPLLLLSRPDVRADLKLSPAESSEAHKAIAALRARVARLHGQPEAQALPQRQAIDEAQRAWFDKHLTPEQRARLLQIHLQWEGPLSVVIRPAIAEELELTPQQSESLQRLPLRHRKRGPSGAPPTIDHQALARDVLTILSPEQQDHWKLMLGHPLSLRTADPNVKQTRGTH